MLKKNRYFIFYLFLSLALFSCKKKSDDAKPSTDCETINLNLFPLSKDIELGRQVDSSIMANPSEYPILDSVQYATSYAYLKQITTNILNGGKVTHKADFAWKTKIIHNDTVLNAFCTPGGYIYVYTGLIKYLAYDDDLAGVLGHEIAHADQRHSTKAMSQEYGISFLLSILVGNNNSQLLNIAKNLTDLKYSRCHESEADAYSVIYLTPTIYKCDGAASFFEKIQDAGGSKTPEFLSTHPDPGNRIINIRKQATDLNCKITYSGANDKYLTFVNSLPK